MAKQTFTTGQVLSAAQMTSLQQTAMGGGSATAKTASYVLTAADAGTVVQMNSASATTITVNAALFAAGDTVQIMNIGTGVCTITAGTATVSTAGSLALSQWEGGQLYFNTASAAIFFDIVQGTGMTNPMTTTGDTIYSSSGSTPARLPIGSTGQVLTVAGGVPTWASAAAAGTSWTLLNTGGTALTGATTITVSGISSKDKIMVIIPLASSVNANVGFKLRFNTDSGTNYYYYGTRMSAASTYSGSNFTGTRNFQEDGVYLGTSQNTNAYAYIAGGLLLNGGASSGVKSFTYTGGGVNIGYNSSEAVTQTGYYDSSSTISSVSIVSLSGNFDDGSIFVYTSN